MATCMTSLASGGRKKMETVLHRFLVTESLRHQFSYNKKAAHTRMLLLSLYGCSQQGVDSVTRRKSGCQTSCVRTADCVLHYDDQLDDVDLEIDIEMPETPLPRNRGRQSKANVNQHGGPAPKSSAPTSISKPVEIQDKTKKPEINWMSDEYKNDPRKWKENMDKTPADPEEKFRTTMVENLEECSQQRLRALHMTFRRYGNVDSRIMEKDLLVAFQENQVALTPRLMQVITELYGDQHGIDYERLHRCLVTAHNQTGRDSVKARQRRADLEVRPLVPQEKRDADFLRRIEELLVRDQTYFDIDTLRSEFQSWDSHRSGKIKTESMTVILSDKSPLYGALLQNLVKRCEEEKNDMISWPMLLSFLEKGQNSARSSCPELASLPDKARATAAVNVAPDPIDELSSSAKARVMSTLLKKASIRRENSSSPTPSARTTTPDAVVPPDPSPPARKKAGGKANAQKKDADSRTDEKKQASNKADDAQDEIIADKTKQNKPGTGAGSSKLKLRKKKTKDSDMPNIPPPLIEVDKISESGPMDVEEGKQTGGASSPNPSSSPAKPDKTSSSAKQDVEQLHEGPAKSKEDAPRTKKVTLPLGGVHVVAPRGYHAVDVPVDPPAQRLNLEWVYGCRGNDCRKNVQLLGSGELIYFISNIVVIYNKGKHTQRHYKEHTEDVKCVAVHSNGMLVASGQFASKLRPQHNAHIRVWRSDRMQTTHVIGGEGSGVTFSNAVMCLAFRPGEDVLAAVDNSAEKYLTIWGLSTSGIASLLAENYLKTETVCDLEFHPKSTDILATSGKEHLAWWKLYPNNNKVQSAALPEYEMNLRPKFVVCLRYTDRGDLISGDSNGTIYIWGDGGRKITNFVKHGHDGPVLAVLYCRQHLITGGRDGFIHAWAWTKNMDKVASLQIPGSEGGVRNLVLLNDALIVSTTMNTLLSITLSKKGCPLEGVTLDPVPVTQGHFDELRGLAVIPRSFISVDVLTAGTDGVLCKFSTITRGPVWKLYMKGMQFYCVDCSVTGEVIVLGTKDGHVVSLEVNPRDMTVVETLNQKVTTERLECIRLSPDGKWMATGSSDRSVYVFRLSQNVDGEAQWELCKILKGHQDRVMSLDFAKNPTKDGAVLLRSSSAVPEQKFWNLQTFEEVNAADMEVVPWATHTCTLDHLLAGVWSSKQALDGQINSVDVGPDKTLVAMGNNVGSLSLYRFPCAKQGAFSHTYRCHQTVQSVRFTPSGNHIVTVGGHDSALLQWRLV